MKLRETAFVWTIAFEVLIPADFDAEGGCKPALAVPYCFIELEPIWNLCYAGGARKPAHQVY